MKSIKEYPPCPKHISYKHNRKHSRKQTRQRGQRSTPFSMGGSHKRSDKPRHSSSRHHSSSYASSMQRQSTRHSYILPGPHGSISARALANSHFLHARRNTYAIQDAAYIKEVSSTSNEPMVMMNFRITPGILLRPNIRQAKIQYPDGTFLHAAPVADVTVLALSSVYRHGRGREYINTPAEVYGRDSVLIVMRSKVLEKLNRHAARIYGELYPEDSMYSFGSRDRRDQEFSFVPCSVRRGATLLIRVRDTVKERRVDRVVGSENHDLLGDALISIKYVRNTSRKKGELLFELEGMIIRRGGARLLNGDD